MSPQTEPLRRYNPLGDHLRKVFGGPVRKLPFSAGLTCPNRDGTRGTGGCFYCSGKDLVPSWFVPGEDVPTQLRRGMEALGRGGARMFIAYLQDHTGTHCAPERLEQVLAEALSAPGVVGLSVGTRPDCLGSPVLDVLESFARRTRLWLEIGLQSSSDSTLLSVGRNHTAAEFADAVRAARARGIETVAHVILGLPGEGRAETDATAGFLATLGVPGVKIHNIMVLRGTRLHEMSERGEFVPPTAEEYRDMAVRFLERLPPGVVIHRLAAEAPTDLLAAPAWARDKSAVIRAVERELERRDTRQSVRWLGSRSIPPGGTTDRETSPSWRKRGQGELPDLAKGPSA
ncbi:MAG: TIGR01212 family radical SAM protein [Deltaproteobacteria bacterium]|nr:TIGR01212 family radical SAM protein [Deltaproteobacteria bacterium]